MTPKRSLMVMTVSSHIAKSGYVPGVGTGVVMAGPVESGCWGDSYVYL